jgi:hypothetical protein
MIDDIAARSEDALDCQLSRRYCQTLSVGFSSGDLGGKASRLMLAGTFNFGDVCQPAWSARTAACAPGDTACEISARCKLIVALLHHGSTSPARTPRSGQIAPKM